jgi:fructose-bisphosphate aldolase class I
MWTTRKWEYPVKGIVGGWRRQVSDQQFQKVKLGRGFVAALDQSGGSTPAALERYGIDQDQYADDDEMFALMHAMRSRIIESPSFDGDHIIGAILFEDTMDREIDGRGSVSYLWDVKRIVPFLKVDKGLAVEQNGVQVMNPIPGLAPLLWRAKENGVFGTKMRSFIQQASPVGVKAVVDQQFEIAKQILAADLVPIIEPEIDIHSSEKGAAEELLKAYVQEHLAQLGPEQNVMLKFSLPDVNDFYADLVGHPKVLRVVALSGGYDRKEADARLAANHGVIASFSRALTEGLSVHQSDDEFNATLKRAIQSILDASLA